MIGMETWKICGLALVALVVFTVVRQSGRDFEVPMKLTAAVVFLGMILGLVRPLVAYVRQLLSAGAVSEYANILLTSLGIAVLTGICADVCRECRETGLASYVELAGRLELLLLCLPLIKDILDSVSVLVTSA